MISNLNYFHTSIYRKISFKKPSVLSWRISLRDFCFDGIPLAVPARSAMFVIGRLTVAILTFCLVVIFAIYTGNLTASLTGKPRLFFYNQMMDIKNALAILL